ncbi:hypothetical protein [Azospirillum sp. Sh1]|uniref:hypothetical protein n=1 Tax=Azospirillum sp. Sh1 TaxID=2607285 RepID=UPI0011ECADFC|nr:hypothetical protein [Azospirillum sp. Sh1]KAA0576060.1 hypothetical protein FZ029_14870 [Azospirillum sp. Sh1]
MVMLAQHGYGKSDKIERGLSAGHIQGVILSPRDEAPGNLASYVYRLRQEYPQSTVFVDPQFYASTVVNPKLGKLGEYAYFQSELTYRDFVAPAAVSAMVSSVMNHQRSLASTHICAPTIAFDVFGDRWCSVALSMAGAAIHDHQQSGDGRPLLISFVISEQACRNAVQLDDFLDIVTDLECDGFYFIVRREVADYNQEMRSEAVSGLMYLSYILGDLNGYQVYHGYSDYISLPLHAAGSTGTACGWQFGLRRFTWGRYEQSTGGRQPRPRYSSLGLLNSIMINPDLEQIARVGLLPQVLTGTNYDRAMASRPLSSVAWPNDISALHHWHALSKGVKHLETMPVGAQRLDELARLLRTAVGVYQRISQTGAILAAASGNTHILQWKDGVEDFRRRAKV